MTLVVEIDLASLVGHETLMCQKPCRLLSSWYPEQYESQYFVPRSGHAAASSANQSATSCGGRSSP